MPITRVHPFWIFVICLSAIFFNPKQQFTTSIFGSLIPLVISKPFSDLSPALAQFGLIDPIKDSNLLVFKSVLFVSKNTITLKISNKNKSKKLP